MRQSERSNWHRLLLAVLKTVGRRIDVRDFNLQCQLLAGQHGHSYHDRMRAAEWLMDQRVLKKVDSTLMIHVDGLPTWLSDELLTGAPLAWSLLDAIDTEGRLARKFDSTRQQEIGLMGEKAVLELLKGVLHPELHRKIHQISLQNDAAGYDIISPSPESVDTRVLLEVKTSLRPGPLFSFFLSRNEARVGAANPNWYLVAVSAEDGKKGLNVFGHLRFVDLVDLLPTNNTSECQWESCAFKIPRASFRAGLPR